MLPCIDKSLSAEIALDQGVPQGSCLGPIIFIDYSSPVLIIINNHGKQGHAYADDHQIYSACHPDSLEESIISMENCVADIKTWMQSMKLKMNDAKTEYILFGTQQQLSKCTKTSITIGDSVIEASEYVRNLGAYFDRNMAMDQHIKVKCRAAYAQLYNIGKIRKYLNDKSAEQLIHALVDSHIDYCNALLVGLPKYLIQKLQMVQNTAASVI